jgi:hypothetical protein
MSQPYMPPRPVTGIASFFLLAFRRQKLLLVTEIEIRSFSRPASALITVPPELSWLFRQNVQQDGQREA